MEQSPSSKIICVGISGGSCSGKSRLVRELQIALGGDAVNVSQDWYYQDNSGLTMEERQTINYDHPASIEWPLLAEHLRQLKQGEAVHAPDYDFPQHTRSAQTQFLIAAPIIILEGILVLHDPLIRPLLDLKIFIDVEEEVRRNRRIERNMLERGRSLEHINYSYQTFVLPMHQKFIEPSRQHADIIWRQLEEPKRVPDIAASIWARLTEHVSSAA